MVRDIPGVTTYWQNENRPGVRKGGPETRQYQFLMSNSLANGALKFDCNLFTVTREKGPKDMLMLLQDQMQRFHFEKKKATDNFGKDRFALTGKVGNLQDDLLITVMMLYYWGRIVMNNPDRVAGTTTRAREYKSAILN